VASTAYCVSIYVYYRHYPNETRYSWRQYNFR